MKWIFNSAYEDWRQMMDDAIAEARVLLDKDPKDPKGLAILEAVDHSMSLSAAFLFGRDTSLGGSDSVQEKQSRIVAKIRQFRLIVAELWRKCGRNVAGLRLRG